MSATRDGLVPYGPPAASSRADVSAAGMGPADASAMTARLRHGAGRWRHTYAIELVRAGVDIHVVQPLQHRLDGRPHAPCAGLDDLRGAVAGVWAGM